MAEINDNRPPNTTSDMDGKSPAQCESAMLLVESLLHGLIARSIITVADAIDIVDLAADVKAEMMADGHGSRFHGRDDILASISASLRLDLPPNEKP